MKRVLGKLLLLGTMLLGLPMTGVLLAQRDIRPYLAFPPQTSLAQHAPFSWPVFAAYALFVSAVLTPLLVQGFRRAPAVRRPPPRPFSFPAWGWIGVAITTAAWILAWSRFPWFAPLQRHTFFPLWIGYIITVNALTYGRTGQCTLCDQPRAFLLLFPVSAAFWWFFEYLNRFVQNWYYVGAQFGPWEYFWYATLPFSTVLPAVMATRELLLSLSWPSERFQHFLPLRFRRPRRVAWTLLFVTGAGLAGIGVWPNHLFPLLWSSPLLILVSVQSLFRESHLFSSIAHGDWRPIVTAALAALICGFFWEMWNAYSLAKWKYNIPFVHGLQVFEMPILGYAGYLPFGLQCATVAQMVLGKTEGRAGDQA